MRELAPSSSAIPGSFVIQPMMVKYRKKYITVESISSCVQQVTLWSLRYWRWRGQNLHRGQCMADVTYIRDMIWKRTIS
jgi:hypothetical protein